jgi:hypothetical protein
MPPRAVSRQLHRFGARHNHQPPPRLNDGGLQFGFFLPGVTRVLSRVSVARQVNCHFFPTPYGTPPLTGRLYLKSEEWAE